MKTFLKSSEMNKIIEYTDLELARNIPNELLTLKKQNANLITNNSFLKKALIVAAVGIGVLLIANFLKTNKDEKRKRNTSTDEEKAENI